MAEREATHQAGLIAGLDVLELLDEPVAAAAHYGLTTGGDRTVLVYDLGGGTFDTTVLRISGGAVTVLATDGHHSSWAAPMSTGACSTWYWRGWRTRCRRTSWMRSQRTSAARRARARRRGGQDAT